MADTDIDEAKFRDGWPMLEEFLKNNSKIIGLIGIFSAVTVYIVSDLPTEVSPSAVGPAYSSGVGIIFILTSITIKNIIDEIGDYGGVFSPACFLLTTFGILFGILTATILLTLSEFLPAVNTMLLSFSLLLPFVFMVWLRNLSRVDEAIETIRSIDSISDKILILILWIILVSQFYIVQNVIGPNINTLQATVSSNIGVGRLIIQMLVNMSTITGSVTIVISVTLIYVTISEMLENKLNNLIE